MSKDKQIDTLYQMINNQNTAYTWTVGIFIAIILALFGVFSYFQWRLNKNQEDEIIKNAIKKLNKEQHIQKRGNVLDQISELYLQEYVKKHMGIEAQLHPETYIDLEGDLLRLKSMIKLVYKNCKYSYQIANLISIFDSILYEVYKKEKNEDIYIRKVVYDIDTILKNEWASDYMEHTNYGNIKKFMSIIPKGKNEDNNETPK